MKAARLLFVMAAAIALVSTSAFATPYQLVLSPGSCGIGASCNGYTFTTVVAQQGVTNKYDITFDIHNTSGLASYIQGFGLTLFAGSVSGNSASLVETPSLGSGITMSLVANDKFNNGNTQCGAQTNHPGSVCVDVTSVNGIAIGGPGSDQKFQFVLTLNNGPILDSWHIMADGTKKANGTGGNIFAISNDGKPNRTQTPEPASMLLMGIGLAGLSAFRKRKR
jgi:hypothetical protein